MPPEWLTVASWIALAAAVATSAAVLVDIYVRGHRQRMWIMEPVWAITALYLGPLLWPAYRRWGRPNAPAYRARTGASDSHGEAVSVVLGVGHCGAGCTLGDIAGAWIVFLAGWHLLGLALPAEYLVSFTLAFALGIAFQYFSIAPMRGLGVGDGIRAALKADALSLIAFEVGLFGWMAFMQFVLFPDPHLTPDHPSYWFLMQIGMALGFLTSVPANVRLIRRGIKEAM
jgi:hypothetical protein